MPRHPRSCRHWPLTSSYVALVRERPTDPRYDAVLAVEENLGVILATARAEQLADPAGIQLHRLAGLDWMAFPRAEAPLWYVTRSPLRSGHMA